MGKKPITNTVLYFFSSIANIQGCMDLFIEETFKQNVKMRLTMGVKKASLNRSLLWEDQVKKKLLVEHRANSGVSKVQKS